MGEPERVLDLGSGLEIWKVMRDDLREQDLNARAMPAEMMTRLVTTIERDKRLESLPLCCVTDKGIEIISGHHRVRAASAAGLNSFYVIVDTTHLTPDQIRAKQLAHNSIQGVDNPQLLQQIYQSIGDAAARLEAFIPPTVEVKVKPVHVDDVSLDFDYHLLTVMFLPTQEEYFKRIMSLLESQSGEVYLAENDVFEPVMRAVKQVVANYQIRSVGSVLAKMADIVALHVGADPRQSDYVSIVDLFGGAYLSADDAHVIEQAISALESRGVVAKKTRLEALLRWAHGELGDA